MEKRSSKGDSKNKKEVTPDDYFRGLDSLARFYNSQITAHVGYLVSVSAFLGAAFVGVSTSILLRTGSFQFELWSVSVCDGWLRFGIPLILFAFLCTWCTGRFPYSLRYLLGGVQYNVALSELAFEHMGLKDNDPNRTGMLRRRTERLEGGIEESLRSLFDARLFASKCRERISQAQERDDVQVKERWENKLMDEDNMREFCVEADEVKFVWKNRSDDFGLVILILPKSWGKRLGFAQRELLFIRYRSYSKPERGRLVESVFDP